MALLERLGYILPICSEDGKEVEVNPGTIAAGYQVSFKVYLPISDGLWGANLGMPSKAAGLGDPSCPVLP